MTLTEVFTSIADAIRAKTGKTDTMTPESMPDEIAGIETGSSVETCTVTINPIYEPGTLNEYIIYCNENNEPTKTTIELATTGCEISVPKNSLIFFDTSYEDYDHECHLVCMDENAEIIHEAKKGSLIYAQCILVKASTSLKASY